MQKDVKTFDSVQYLPLIRLCERYDLKWEWDPFIKKAVIERRGRRIVLRAGSDRMLVDGNEKRLDRPVLLDAGAVLVPVSFVRNDLSALVEPPFEKPPPEAVSKRFTIQTVVVDPGHGGKDPGAIGRKFKVKEKGLTLAIAKRLKGILEQAGMRVVMTRDADIFIPLPRRAEIANSSGADLFVSVHINASRSKAMRGFECYYLSDATDDNARALEAMENASPEVDGEAEAERSRKLDATLWDLALSENRRESADLAAHICASVENSLVTKNRGIRSARFYVLKWTRMPSVLVEIGYLSNRYEEMKLNDERFVVKMADVLAQGILAYKKEYERTEGYTNI